MEIRILQKHEDPPMDLLLLADPSTSLIEKYIKESECVVALVENKIIGICALLQKDASTVEIVNIAVAAYMQDQGIGKQLVIHAKQRAQKNGFKRLEVGTGNSSISQLAFYQKCGFRITSIEFDYFINHYAEEIYENGIQCKDMIRLSLELE
jgi:ribosomal protein S18 acetylase RimI-like enzyme